MTQITNFIVNTLVQAVTFTSQKENGMNLSSNISQQTLPPAYSYCY